MSSLLKQALESNIGRRLLWQLPHLLVVACFCVQRPVLTIASDVLEWAGFSALRVSEVASWVAGRAYVLGALAFVVLVLVALLWSVEGVSTERLLVILSCATLLLWQAAGAPWPAVVVVAARVIITWLYSRLTRDESHFAITVIGLMTVIGSPVFTFMSLVSPGDSGHSREIAVRLSGPVRVQQVPLEAP
ncbi:hypothetical protein GZ998_10140 [Actinomyces sp. 594]|uniref:hypothetical protein n=1 Tax=Actinomyces sp. 594 TaxID=2057793 RepID=UPI001C59A7D1|nr:hypothetical protein [Actinomyces sp. 594]MBW3069856.1 hypothetical protein [Actinomyces sp. 594]